MKTINGIYSYYFKSNSVASLLNAPQLWQQFNAAFEKINNGSVKLEKPLFIEVLESLK